MLHRTCAVRLQSCIKKDKTCTRVSLALHVAPHLYMCMHMHMHNAHAH